MEGIWQTSGLAVSLCTGPLGHPEKALTKPGSPQEKCDSDFMAVQLAPGALHPYKAR